MARGKSGYKRDGGLSKKIRIIWTSTPEAETEALMEVSKHLIATGRILDEIGMKQKCYFVYTDNEPAELIGNQAHPSRNSRSWRIRGTHLQELTQDGVIKILHMPGTIIPADAGTKHAIPKFRTLARRVCAMDPVIPAEYESETHEAATQQGMGEKQGDTSMLRGAYAS